MIINYNSSEMYSLGVRQSLIDYEERGLGFLKVIIMMIIIIIVITIVMLMEITMVVMVMVMVMVLIMVLQMLNGSGG